MTTCSIRLTVLLMLLFSVGLGLTGCESGSSEQKTAQSAGQQDQLAEVDSPNAAGSGVSEAEQDFSPAPGPQPDWEKMKPGSNLGISMAPNGEPAHFSLYVPDSYFESDDRSYPLILALHPGGPNVDFYGQGVMDGLVRPALEKLEPVILAPDSLGGRWTTQDNLDNIQQLLADVEQNMRIDSDRTLVVGYSMGGQGAWHFASQMPDYFKATIPIAGRVPQDVDINMPVRAVHSTGDQVVRLQPTQQAIAALKSADPDLDIELIVLEGPTHYERIPYVQALEKLRGWVEEIWNSASAK